MSQQHLIPECNTALNTVFIKGLSKGTTEKCIQSLFGKFGTLIDCQASSTLPIPVVTRY